MNARQDQEMSHKQPHRCHFSFHWAVWGEETKYEHQILLLCNGSEAGVCSFSIKTVSLLWWKIKASDTVLHLMSRYHKHHLRNGNRKIHPETLECSYKECLWLFLDLLDADKWPHDEIIEKYNKKGFVCYCFVVYFGVTQKKTLCTAGSCHFAPTQEQIHSRIGRETNFYTDSSFNRP